MQNTTTIAQTSSKRVQAVPIATTTGQFVYIRVHNARLTSATNPSPPTGQQSSRHLYLIEGRFEDITRYAGTTVDWIIRIAHLLCEPLGVGHVFTHTRGTSSDWYNVDRTASWREVVHGDRLLPGIYEFEPTHPVILSKISDRQNHSLTTPGSESSSSAFRTHTTRRDAACVVTRSAFPVVASHLVPKRIGSDGAKDIVERFVGVTEAVGIHRYDPRIGIILLDTLDRSVDNYQVGFYHVTNNTYALHNFNIDHPEMTIFGTSASSLPILQNIPLPPLHRFSVTLSVHGGDYPLPPLGVFNWHYLQCVIRRFGTPQYRGVPNINLYLYPFRTASDSSSDEISGDNDTNPPYPSYHFDQYLRQQSESHWALEDRTKVLQWASGVSSGIC